MKELSEQVICYLIFTRLPVKSLIRCKSVCKSWLSLLSDPKFAKEHYNVCAMQNPNDYDRLVAQKDSTGLVILSRHEDTCILPPDHNRLTKLIGSIHGLLCLRHNNKLWLWNPAIHQAKQFLPPCSWINETWSPCYWDNYGFGFDPFSNDYKLVVLNINNGPYNGFWYGDKWSAFVYYFNSDKWRPLIVPDSVFPTVSAQISYRAATIVKDCPYWTYRHWSGESIVCNVLKFLTRSDEFKLLPKFHGRKEKNAVLVNMMDRPTLMEYEQDSQNISVDLFSLDEAGSGVWSKMYSVGPIGNYGLKQYMSQGFKYGGEIVVYNCGNFSYYEKKADKISLIPGDYSFGVASCYGYTPSLIFPQGMKLDTPLVSID